MCKIMDTLLSKYERVDKLFRQKAIVLFLSISALFLTLLLTSMVKFFLFEVTSTDRYYQFGLIFSLFFIFALLYRRLLKHAIFIFLIWIAAYYLYLLTDQEILIYILVPILFTIMFLVQTSKYQTLTYILLSIGFLITDFIRNIDDFNHEVISSLHLISFFVSILYISSNKQKKNQFKIS